MAKMFYTAEEAADRLGGSEAELKKLVREGKLREFRDAGSFNYKVGDVDALAGPALLDSGDSGFDDASASASGDILLEPIEDSGIELAAGGSDVIMLEEGDPEDSGADATAVKKAKKGDTVVPSVGVNVFDDDELDEHVDPLAQTAITDVAGLGVEGAGSGSGILDLTRESDDTSLGAELLDEITGEHQEDAAIEMGEATRAGLEAAGEEEAAGPLAEDEGGAASAGASGLEEETVVEAAGAAVRTVVEYGPDAVSTSLTALMVVAVGIMWIAGLGGAALVRGVYPSLLKTVYANLMVCAGGALGAAVIAGAATYFVMKKRAG